MSLWHLCSTLYTYTLWLYRPTVPDKWRLEQLVLICLSVTVKNIFYFYYSPRWNLRNWISFPGPLKFPFKMEKSIAEVEATEWGCGSWYKKSISLCCINKKKKLWKKKGTHVWTVFISSLVFLMYYVAKKCYHLVLYALNFL